MANVQLPDGFDVGWFIRLIFKLSPFLQRLRDERNEFLMETKKSKVELMNAKSKLDAMKSQLNELTGRYQLVSAAISAKVSHSERAAKFSEIIEQKFMPFANNENVLANEAEVILRLKVVEEQFHLVEAMSRFNAKSLVAVAGGFSSGKSSFISSLFSDANVRLPIGIQPITAIPTYVFHADINRIVGYSKNGGEVEIEAEIYAQLSHEFVQKFGFNLRDLLPFIALETPIESYRNLAFIDLPGYNPGSREGYTVADEGSASEFMHQAQSILWVIGLDANGTISRSDVDFLRDHVPDDARLYVVLNKADLKPESHLHSIMQEVADMLYEDGVSYEGISAYSSNERREICFLEKSIVDVLRCWNKPKDTYAFLLKEIDSVFQEYREALNSDIKNRKAKEKMLKALELDLHELGAFDDESGDQEKFDVKSIRKRLMPRAPQNE